MRSKAVLLTTVLFTGVVLGVLGTQMVGAQSEAEEPIVQEELARQALTTAEGNEAIVVRARFAPDAAMSAEPTLEHPAEEFVYVLEGTALMTREGEEPIEFSEGDAWYNDLALPHTLANASSSEPLRVLAVWIGEEGAF